MMPELHRPFEDELCPVAAQVLGELYRASAQRLNELIAPIPPRAKAHLAMYYYRRAHLASIGLVIAAACDKDDLTLQVGNAGASLFHHSQVDQWQQPALRQPAIALASGRHQQ